MKSGLKNLFAAVAVMMFCLPATAFAKPHSNHSNGGYHQQYNNGRHHNKPQHHASPPARQCGMTSNEFSTFVSLVNKTTFRSQKMELIKAAAASNSFTVSQILQTMDLMTFSSDKVDIAEAMYDHVCDYNNWYMVYSAFDFDMYVRDLKKRIGQS